MALHRGPLDGAPPRLRLPHCWPMLELGIRDRKTGSATEREMSVLTIRSLTMAAQDAERLGSAFSTRRKGELFYDAILFALLTARHGRFARQWKLPVLANQSRPVRIDYKERHKKGAVIEFAVRSKTGTELLPSQNRSELRKLLRAGGARVRFLLLLDPSRRPAHSRTDTQNRFRAIRLGRGRLSRRPVRVVYARAGHSFHFVWHP